MSSVEQQERREAGEKPATDFDAVIVGAGFSGLYMLHSLRDYFGLSARVLETGDGVGNYRQQHCAQVTANNYEGFVFSS